MGTYFTTALPSRESNAVLFLCNSVQLCGEMRSQTKMKRATLRINTGWLFYHNPETYFASTFCTKSAASWNSTAPITSSPESSMIFLAMSAFVP